MCNHFSFFSPNNLISNKVNKKKEEKEEKEAMSYEDKKIRKRNRSPSRSKSPIKEEKRRYKVKNKTK